MFEEFFSFDYPEVKEQRAASRGICPTARKCADLDELAYWFYLAGVAAGAIHRSVETE